MTETDKIIREEIDAILSDIIKVYEQSGRKVSGQFEEGLEAVYEPNKATIKGFVYLAGRGESKKGNKPGKLVGEILKWMEKKGIAAKIRAEAKTTKAKIYLVRGIAWRITDNIHKAGTDPDKWLRVYEQVITQERILSIVDRVSELNVNKLITEVRAELEILQKNV